MQSVAYTAVPMFSIAAVWFLGFGLCLFTIGVCYFCRKREPYGYSPTCYALSLILLMLFTFTAVCVHISLLMFLLASGFVGSLSQIALFCVNRIGCAVLYIGQGSFHHSMSSTLQYVVHQADSTVDKLRNVSDYLNQAKQVGIDRIFLPTNVQTDIDAAETDINNSAGTLADKTKENSDNIQDLLDSA